MRSVVVLLILLAGCTNPSNPVETPGESGQGDPGADFVADEVVAWYDCEQASITVPVDAGDVGVPSGWDAVPGALPNTVAYTIWGIRCADNVIAMGLLELEGDGRNVHPTWVRFDGSDALPADVVTQDGPTQVTILDGFEVGGVNARSLMANMRVAGTFGTVGDPTNPLDVVAVTTEPMRTLSLGTVTLVDAAGLGVLAIEQELSEFHAGAGEAVSTTSDLPWDGPLAGAAWFTAGSATGAHLFDLEWAVPLPIAA